MIQYDQAGVCRGDRIIKTLAIYISDLCVNGLGG